MREVTIEDHQFVIGKLDPKRAFHVVRRLAPLVGSLRDFIPYLIEQRTVNPDNLEEVALLIEPVARGLAEMPEADADYVIDTCLSVVMLRDSQTLTPIQVGGGHLMYEWIGMPLMVRLVFETVMENLAGFMPAGARAS